MAHTDRTRSNETGIPVSEDPRVDGIDDAAVDDATGSDATGSDDDASDDTATYDDDAYDAAFDDAAAHDDDAAHHDTAGSTAVGGGPVAGRKADRDAVRRAAVRDHAVAAKPAFPRFLQVVVALFFPVIVVAAAVRAVATSSFLWFEYHRPGFPADRFGFSPEERMTYGSYALDYVLNLAPPQYLGGLVTSDGESLFLDSEVGHMADVKGVLGVGFLLGLVLFVLAVLACVYLARRYRGGVRRALFAGAVLTLVGGAALAVLAVLAWEAFFTQVHAVFFPDGTWTFRVDDTLIRLFPEQFWLDSALTVGILVLGATILTLIVSWPTRARRERSILAQEEEYTRFREALENS